MIKRAIAITMTVALILAQSTVAGAFQSDVVTIPALTASADLYTGIAPVATMTVTIKNIAGGSAGSLGWSGVNLGDAWKVSGQYVEVAYNANQSGFGVQVYTDNMPSNVNANPSFGGDPTKYINEQASGLIGAGEPGTGANANNRISCPLAILVTDDVLTSGQIETPVEATSGTPGEDSYLIYFTSGYDENVVKTGSEKVWFWVKDKNTTKWDDLDSDGEVDTPTTGGGYGVDPTYEVVSNFADGEDYATIVNTFGSSTGWYDTNAGRLYRDEEAGTTLNVYVAAKFSKARERQVYKTNTLTLELYHE